MTPENNGSKKPDANAPEDNVQDGIVLSPEEQKRRRSRSIAIGLVLGALVVLFYAVTVAKLGVNVLNRPL